MLLELTGFKCFTYLFSEHPKDNALQCSSPHSGLKHFLKPLLVFMCIMEDGVIQCATQPSSFIEQKKALWLHEASPNIIEVMLLV